ncbi:MAG: prepilin peptidase [Candidatus Omnitrophota bacterium]|jgi:leader peptidase (prepilin peptidase)/N-methyltransferase|nr:MAG: prepilin peptidase [Candidatus Omnitrophota bacterium]
MNVHHLPMEFIIIAAGLFGAAAGSFLHVCIWRIPRETSIVTPASRTPCCDVSIRWYDNIPILSYCILLGRCRYCRSSISLRYLIYEIVTALLFAGIVYKFGISLTTLLYLIMTMNLIVASGIDWDHQYIPDFLSLPMIPAALVVAALVQWTGMFPQALVQNIRQAIVGCVVGGGIIWGIRIIGAWVFQQEAMGFGDVKLMAFMGGFLGWDETLLCIFLASLLGSCVGIGLKMAGKIDKYGRIPFGPYLCAGAYLCLLFGPEIIQWYTNPLFSP